MSGNRFGGGHGERAERREKFLSKPLEKGKSLYTLAPNSVSGKFMRHLAHHIDRQVVHKQLALLLEGMGDFSEEAPLPPKEHGVHWSFFVARDKHASAHATGTGVCINRKQSVPAG